MSTSNLYPLKDSRVQTKEMISCEDGSFIDWKGQLPQKEQPQIEAIIDKRISKKARNKDYFQIFLSTMWTLNSY